jgi:hypothetical protein
MVISLRIKPLMNKPLMNKPSMFFVPLLISIALSCPAAGTTIQYFGLAELTQHAATIFLGTCDSAVDVEIDGHPYKRISFAVHQTLKGEKRATRTVYLPGGQSKGQLVRYVGMPHITPDEEIVLFLTPADPQGHAWPVGLSQGKFSVRRADGSARVGRDLHGASLYGTPAPGAAKAAERLDGMPLDQFLQHVRHLLVTDIEETGDKRAE